MKTLNLCCFLLTFYCQSISGDTLDVTIFYGASCPYSRNFVRELLLPGYKILGDVLKIKIYPFTARTIDDDGVQTVQCTYDSNDCISQSYGACVLKSNYDTLQKIQFLDCQMNIDPISDELKIKECAEKFQIRWDKLRSCHRTKRGKQILKEFNEMQLSRYDVNHVPFLIFNDVYDRETEIRANSDGLLGFLLTACRYLESPPLGCPK